MVALPVEFFCIPIMNFEWKQSHVRQKNQCLLAAENWIPHMSSTDLLCFLTFHTTTSVALHFFNIGCLLRNSLVFMVNRTRRLSISPFLGSMVTNFADNQYLILWLLVVFLKTNLITLSKTLN
jgi:hypothetical protein